MLLVRLPVAEQITPREVVVIDGAAKLVEEDAWVWIAADPDGTGSAGSNVPTCHAVPPVT